MKPKTFKFNSLLEVTWIDIVDDSAWLSPYIASKYPPCTVKSVGYFLNRDERVIRISSSYQPEDKDRSVTVIPWGCIEQIKRNPA